MGCYEKYKGSGIYYVKYPYARDPLTDAIKYKTEKVGPKKIAQRLFNKKMSEWAEKKFYGLGYDIAFSDLVHWYLNQKEKAGKKSIKKDKEHCALLENAFGSYMVSELKPHFIKEFRDILRVTRSKREKYYSNATINKIMQVGRHMFNLGIDNEIINSSNPFKGVFLQENNARDRILSSDEYNKLISVAPQHLSAIIEVAYNTGMRSGEILNLTWDKVNFKEDLISLESQDTKTEYPRLVFFNQRIRNILEDLHKVRAIHHNFVFTYKGNPIKSINTAFRTALRKAKIVDFHFHDLRHTYNTNLRKAGVERSVIMKLTGHRTMAMFLRYDTVDKDDAKAAMEKLERFMCAGNCSYSAPKGIEVKK